MVVPWSAATAAGARSGQFSDLNVRGAVYPTGRLQQPGSQQLLDTASLAASAPYVDNQEAPVSSCDRQAAVC